MDGYRREERTPDDKATDARDVGVQSDGGEDIPRGHGSSIIISGETSRSICIELVLDAANCLFGQGRSASKVIGPGCLQARFIAHVDVLATGTSIELSEKSVQTVDNCRIATYLADEASQVKGFHPGGLR